ncbi:hypothetical protein [Mesorhizobium sp. M6A.T.Cr.TU.016.01.1.1]|uniref:hypothetical protein n=1 Tax=Mesorhizobium sp. M6A.T.Cr.TU.016.01.1.1 TaxID=2493677 RepID=UPI000F75EFA4|nr:hypothetical protein [Mesorhizobium sp. M6A.T.Cr.TU.016.01.1.1]AZO68416.1 hypothetical protein EJ075_28215 [Mesorhizobium sp. M6A.T.Cr.TU.016.01.1.1]
MTREISLNHLDRQLELLLSKVDALHRLVFKNNTPPLPPPPPPPSSSPGQPAQQKFVTIEQFVIDMLGYKSRISYYDHVKDPGWPQRAYLAGKPLLVYDECVAFLQRMMDARNPPPPFKRPEPPDGKKRHIGRPAKVPRRS